MASVKIARRVEEKSGFESNFGGRKKGGDEGSGEGIYRVGKYARVCSQVSYWRLANSHNSDLEMIEQVGDEKAIKALS